MRKAPLESASGPGGCTNEVLRVCLEDPEVLQLLSAAAEDFTRGTAPLCATRAFTMATMTTFRRLVAKTLARQFSKVVEATCSPFQLALSTRAGVDCVGHAVRAATNMDPEMTVLSIDGVGAYDRVYRSAMLSKLLEVPALRPLLPFVRTVYARPSTYLWTDDQGERHEIRQSEGGKQGDPLMPLLFFLAIHNSLVAAKAEMQMCEQLFAFLDDVNTLTTPGRTRSVYNLLGEKLALEGIRLHTGRQGFGIGTTRAPQHARARA